MKTGKAMVKSQNVIDQNVWELRCVNCSIAYDFNILHTHIFTPRVLSTFDWFINTPFEQAIKNGL